MNSYLGVIGWISDSIAYTHELTLYGLHAIWVTVVKACVTLLGAVDDLLPDLEIADNALWRTLIMGAVGFILGVVLTIFVSFITGNWRIPCVFTMAIAFCAFVGLVADPEGDWNLGDLPMFGGRGGGPSTPLSL